MAQGSSACCMANLGADRYRVSPESVWVLARIAQWWCYLRCASLARPVHTMVRTAGEAARAILTTSVEDCMATMKVHRSAVDVHIAGCLVMFYRFCTSGEGRVHASQAGATEAVSEALAAHRGDAALEEAACKALQMLAQDNAGIQEEATRRGLLDAMFNFVVREKSPPGVVLEALWALRQLLGLPENRLHAGRLGLVEAIAALMRVRPEDEDAQVHALATLEMLFLGCKENQDRGAEVGIADLVIQDMKAFLNEDVHTYACVVLQNLTFQSPRNQQLAADAGGLECVLTSMRTFAGAAPVHEFACGAIWNLVDAHLANHARATELGAEAEVIKSIRAFPGHEGVQEHACGALIRLAPPGKDGDIRQRMGSNIDHFYRYQPPRKGFSTWTAAGMALSPSRAPVPVLALPPRLVLPRPQPLPSQLAPRPLSYVFGCKLRSALRR